MTRDRLISAILVAVVGGVAPTAAGQGDDAPENRRCLDCHGQPHIAQLSPRDRRTMVTLYDQFPSEQALAGEPATRPGLYIEYDQVYRFSVHRQVACVACHQDCLELPHPPRLEPARCGDCHGQVQEEYDQSVHARAIKGGDEFAAHCADCHGTHDILSSRNPQSRTYKLRLPYTCASCHSNQALMEATGVHQPLAADHYADSMHGHFLLDQGLLAAPSCNDCHGVHDIRNAEDPASTIHKDNVPQTCGGCHTAVQETYARSTHGLLLAAGDERGPVCTTCHTAHEITRPGETAFQVASQALCGNCHADRLSHYRETFHGKAMALGLPSVAGCHDCHGHHDILPASDPASRLSDENRLETCRKCHPKAGGNFAGFIAHADHTDRHNYPVLFWTFVLMTAIIVGTFAFFGLHTIMWFAHGIVARLQNPAAFREARAAAARDTEEFVKFRPFDRFLHVLVVLSFLLLVATGMPLKFYYTGWAQWMVGLMGGLEMAGFLHRVGAIVTFGYFALHLGSLVTRAVRNRRDLQDPQTGKFRIKRLLAALFGPDMPVFTHRDIAEWWSHQKWFLGRGPRPQFDKWSYWEKFDYFAVFWGVAVIGVSGLVMWFPEAFTRVLPGWIINVALIVHSDEALLAAGFIFTFHFFNSHFRPDKFPMDPVIFSGRVSRTEMLHERRRWYDRLVATNRLEDIRYRDEWSQWKRVMHPLGFIALVIGLVLLVLIIVAMGSRLVGAGP